VSDEYVSALERLLDEKFEIMRVMTEELGTLQDAAVILNTIRRSRASLRRFRVRVEEPFGLQFADRIASDTTAMRSLSEKHRPVFDAFISTLQRLKYDPSYVADVEIAAAIEDFEFATARIPERAPG